MKRFFLIVLIMLGSVSLCFSADYLPKHKEGTVIVLQIINKNVFGSENNSISIKALSPRMIAGKKVTPWVSQSGFIQYQLRNKIGYFIFATQSPSDVEPQIKDEPKYILKYPLKAGTTWQQKETTYLLEKKFEVNCKITIESTDDIVTMPAGTFENCLRTKKYGKKVMDKNSRYGSCWVSIEVYEWFAPKIGWIKTIIKHNTDHSKIGFLNERIILLKEYKYP